MIRPSERHSFQRLQASLGAAAMAYVELLRRFDELPILATRGPLAGARLELERPSRACRPASGGWLHIGRTGGGIQEIYMHPTTGELRRWDDRNSVAGEEPNVVDFEPLYWNVGQLLADVEVHPEYSPVAVIIARVLAAHPDEIFAPALGQFTAEDLEQLAGAAALYGRTEVVEQCLERGVPASGVLPPAVQGEHLSLVRWLVEERGASPTVPDWYVDWTTPEVRSYLLSRRS